MHGSSDGRCWPVLGSRRPLRLHGVDVPAALTHQVVISAKHRAVSSATGPAPSAPSVRSSSGSGGVKPLSTQPRRDGEARYELQQPSINRPQERPTAGGVLGAFIPAIQEAPHGMVREAQGFWGKTRLQPLNPQISKPQGLIPLPKKDPTRQFQLKPNDRHKLSEDQIESLLDHYASKQWYGFFWNRVKWIPVLKMRSMMKWARVGIVLAMFGMFMITCFVYRQEADLFNQMEADEQRDYRKVIWGARMSDVVNIATETLDKIDPLRVLPEKQQMTIIVNALRDAGMVDKDWEVERRTMPSLLRHPDWKHIGYWAIMYAGRLLLGGGSLFWWGPEGADGVDFNGAGGPNVPSRMSDEEATRREHIDRAKGIVPTGKR